MEADKLINQAVVHKSFGKGIIRSLDEKYLEVDFAEKGKVSRFPYPFCFDVFLALEDNSLQTEIDVIVREWKEANGVLQKEELWQQYEKTMHGIEARRIAAEEKKLKAAQRAMEHRIAYGGNNRK